MPVFAPQARGGSRSAGGSAGIALFVGAAVVGVSRSRRTTRKYDLRRAWAAVGSPSGPEDVCRVDAGEGLEEGGRVGSGNWSHISRDASNLFTAADCRRCGAAQPSSAEEMLTRQMSNAELTLAKERDRLLRLRADFQNYRRNHAESLAQASEASAQELILKLTLSSDHMDEVLRFPAGEAITAREKAVFESFLAIFNKSRDVVSRAGAKGSNVSVDETAGVRALGSVASPPGNAVKVDQGTVSGVAQSGWKPRGRDECFNSRASGDFRDESRVGYFDAGQVSEGLYDDLVRDEEDLEDDEEDCRDVVGVDDAADD